MLRLSSSSLLTLGLLFCLPGYGAAQKMLGMPGYMSLSQTMLPTLPGGSMLSGLGSQGEGGTPVLQDMNVLFESVVDSLYLLGSGDILTLGMGTRIVSLPVNPEGMVVLENIGPVPVGNQTLRAAKKLLIEHMSKAYKGDKVFVTMGRAKKVQASIVGAVYGPGIYTVSAAARLSDMVVLAGGLSPNANKRITVSVRGNETRTFDLDRYFLRNDITHNPYVQAGAQLMVEEVDYGQPVVEVRENDQVATVQLKDSQSVYDVVMAHNIFKKSRHWNRILVYEDGTQMASLSIKDAKTHFPKPNSLLEVRSNKPLVFVSGAVARPSSYEFNSNFTALDYISSAGIMFNTGKFDNVLIIGPDGGHRNIDSSKDRIAPGDHIIVPESNESRVKDYITLFVSVASIVLSATLTIITINN